MIGFVFRLLEYHLFFTWMCRQSRWSRKLNCAAREREWVRTNMQETPPPSVFCTGPGICRSLGAEGGGLAVAGGLGVGEGGGGVVEGRGKVRADVLVVGCWLRCLASTESLDVRA